MPQLIIHFVHTHDFEHLENSRMIFFKLQLEYHKYFTHSLLLHIFLHTCILIDTGLLYVLLSFSWYFPCFILKPTICFIFVGFIGPICLKKTSYFWYFPGIIHAWFDVFPMLLTVTEPVWLIPPVIARASRVPDECVRGRASLIIPSDRQQQRSATASRSRVCVHVSEC